MAMNVKNREAEELARKVSAVTGESLTAAIVTSLRERLERLEQQRRRTSTAAQLNAIARRCAALPVLDDRAADQIIGYDENGAPR